MADRKRGVRGLGLGLLAVLMLGLSGCDVDSYMDPSAIGRFENTPVVLPILDRLDVIEEPEEAIPGLSTVRSEDLIPEVSEYVLGPGDLIEVTVFELITPNVESVQRRRIDELGYIRLPVIGQVKAGGRSAKELEQRITEILDPNILRDPTVSVVVLEGRQNTFNVVGAVGQPGPYNILKTDFRVMDAVSLARGIPSDAETLFVIRQVPLAKIVEEGYQFDGGDSPETGDGDGAGSEGDGAEPSPGELLEQLERELDGGEPAGGEGAGAEEGSGSPGRRGGDPLGEALEAEPTDGGRWVNVDGRWVQVQSEAEEGAASGGEPAAGALPAPEQLVTQRVIEIDAQKLLQGVATQNIVIRPDDIVRVPAPRTGNVYISGEIARPGTYALPGEKELTLTQLVSAAGGLGPLAIPERVDLRRRLGSEEEAIIRLNLRAIAEGVQPNIYLKPHDEIVVGTNLWASFAAVIRNSFRMTYGFGFLLDRNFGADVFGPVPTDRR